MNQVTTTLLLLPPQFVKPDVLTTLPPKPEPGMNLSKYDEYTRQYVLQYKDKMFPKQSSWPVFDESVPTNMKRVLDSYEFMNLSVDELYEFLESVTDYCQQCLLETLVSTCDLVFGFVEPYDSEPYSTMFEVLDDKYDETPFDYDDLNDSTKWQKL